MSRRLSPRMTGPPPDLQCHRYVLPPVVEATTTWPSAVKVGGELRLDGSLIRSGGSLSLVSELYRLTIPSSPAATMYFPLPLNAALVMERLLRETICRRCDAPSACRRTSSAFGVDGSRLIASAARRALSAGSVARRAVAREDSALACAALLALRAAFL